MDYELRVIVEKVSVSSQEIVQRDTLKVYDIEAPTSILELGLRHEEQISLLEKVAWFKISGFWVTLPWQNKPSIFDGLRSTSSQPVQTMLVEIG